MAEAVAVLRAADLLISSRFHALVGAMPGLGPAIGVATDERIRNLLDASRVVAADAPDLGPAIVAAARALDPAAIAEASRATVAEALEGIGRMGMAFVAEIRRLYPAFPILDRGADWRAHLPPLSKDIAAFIQDP